MLITAVLSDLGKFEIKKISKKHVEFRKISEKLFFQKTYLEDQKSDFSKNGPKSHENQDNFEISRNLWKLARLIHRSESLFSKTKIFTSEDTANDLWGQILAAELISNTSKKARRLAYKNTNIYMYNT